MSVHRECYVPGGGASFPGSDWNDGFKGWEFLRFVADGFDLEFLDRVSSTPPGHVVKVIEVVNRLIVETLQSRTPKTFF